MSLICRAPAGAPLAACWAAHRSQATRPAAGGEPTDRTPNGVAMRHNGRPRLLASTLAPTRIDPETRTIVCPRCQTWRGLTRSIIRVHSRPTDDDRVQGDRCSGSGQRITMDLTVDEWRRRLV